MKKKKAVEFRTWKEYCNPEKITRCLHQRENKPVCRARNCPVWNRMTKAYSRGWIEKYLVCAANDGIKSAIRRGNGAVTATHAEVNGEIVIVHYDWVKFRSNEERGGDESQKGG